MHSIQGKIKHLSEGRLIFVGQDVEDLNNKNYYLGFVNSNNEKTRIVLSEDAFNALKELMSSPVKEGIVEPFPPDLTPEWKIISSLKEPK